MTKRCTVCARKVDEGGNCTNEKCPAYLLAQINKAAEESKADADEKQPFNTEGLIVNFPPMTYSKRQNNKLFVLNLTDKAVIANAVPPLTVAISGKGFAIQTRIFTIY